MNESLRQKKVASLIKEELSRLLIVLYRDVSPGLITITRVDMSKDLRTAQVYLSFYKSGNNDEIISQLDKQKGQLRKAVASKIKLKYNPMLIFSEDPLTAHEDRINELLKQIRDNEK
ncbi:30S ribosome-binding factor RbfA [Acidobacteriota bacterium]